MYELKNVSFKYENIESEQGIKDISLTIETGSVVLVCGESGCGKSTLLRLLNGLIPHYYKGTLLGQVLFNGDNLKDKRIDELAGKIGTVFQNPKSQFFSVNAGEEVVFGCENMGLPREKTMARLGQAVHEFAAQELVPKSLFALSGGEKQRIACASVAAMLPETILLDEPSSNLDIAAIEDLKCAIARWKRQGKTIVASEHRLHYWIDLADRILYMKNGKIILDMPARKFFSKSAAEMAGLGLRSPYPIEPHTAVPLGKAGKQGEFQLSNFEFTYKGEAKNALCIPHMEIPKGEIIAIIGHNGAGKSTFARCMCGLEKRVKGSIIHGNRKRSSRYLSDLCFMVMQNVEHQLFAESVEEEIRISMQKADHENKQMKVEKILQELNLMPQKDLHPQSLSGGEKQRVAIGCALATEKPVIFFDEPTSGLDFRHMLIVAEILKTLKDKGKTIFLITHDAELLFHCATYYMELSAGRIKSKGQMGEAGWKYISGFFDIQQLV